MKWISDAMKWAVRVGDLPNGHEINCYDQSVDGDESTYAFSVHIDDLLTGDGDNIAVIEIHRDGYATPEDAQREAALVYEKAKKAMIVLTGREN